MFITVSKSDFHDAFNAVRPNNFSYEGLDALFEYLSTEDVELDVIALCCEFSEDSNVNHLANYGLNSLEDLENSTTVIRVDDETSIIQDF